MRKQPKRGTGADSQSHKPSLSCYADSACSGKVWTAPAVCLGMLEGSSKPQGQQPGEQPWGAAPLLLRFCLPSPAAASSSSPPPRHACPQRCPRALTEEGAGDGVPVLMLLLEVPELLGLLAHVDGQPGPHHPTDRAASERSAHRIARGTQPAAFSPHCPQKQPSRLRNSPRFPATHDQLLEQTHRPFKALKSLMPSAGPQIWITSSLVSFSKSAPAD